jgi:hypothetical protein
VKFPDAATLCPDCAPQRPIRAFLREGVMGRIPGYWIFVAVVLALAVVAGFLVVFLAS